MANNKNKKIGLIGNMNNNNFAFLRYLIDLGFDAKLILMKNDGTGVASGHFSIESDTWDIEKWSKHVIQSNICEHPISALNFPISSLFSLYHFLKRLFGATGPISSVSKKHIREIISEFDILIGSGIAPAALSRVNKRLSVFYPYAIGIEYLDDFVFQAHLNSNNPAKNIIARMVYNRQLHGLKMARSIAVGDIGVTKDSLKSMNLNFVEVFVPFLYNKETADVLTFKHKYSDVINKIRAKNFVILSQVRHHWANSEKLSEHDWQKQNKHNDWILKGFEKFLKEKPDADALLILFEYGADVEASKVLAKTLGLESRILWLKLAPRKEILQLIDFADLGIGEFYSGIETTWGGAMVELMSRGKPTIHGLNITKFKLEKELKIDHPPILVANNISEIAKNISFIYENKNKAKSIGLASREWFEKNYGIGLVEQWIKLFD